MATAKIPKSALHFQEDLQVSLSETDEERKASMLGYSGKPMKHWLFGDMVVDVSGIKFQNSKIPILEDHEEEKKIGFSSKPSLDDNQVFFSDITLLDNEEANEFYNNAKKGFPYQASISFYPKIIEHVEEGAKTKVNGFTQKGPALIFRESIFRESSICTFGMDHRTSSVAHNDEQVSVFLNEESAKILEEFIPKTKENNMSDEKITEYEAKLSEMQQKVQEYETKLNETNQQLEQSAVQMSEMQKQVVKKDLADLTSSENVDFLMKFYDKLSADELKEFGAKLASLEKVINEEGLSRGSEETPSEGNHEPSPAEVQAYASKHSISWVEANNALFNVKQ